MKRDGALKSLWQNDITGFTSNTITIPDQNFDVVIVGGGMTGIVTGLLLQKKAYNASLQNLILFALEPQGELPLI